MTDKLKTALKFYQSQSPTDANKCYVSDIYASHFSLADLCRFAEAYDAQQSKMPTEDVVDKIETLLGYLKVWELGVTHPPAEVYALIEETDEWLRNQIG